MRFPEKASEAFRAQFSNQLDQFRSYTFHFVWALARNTETAVDMFATKERVDQIVQSGGTAKQDGGVRTPFFLKGKETDPNGQIVVLVNSMKDADLRIDSLRLSGVTQPPDVSTGANTMISQEVFMNLIEPMGVRFLNIYRQSLIDLNVNNADCVSVLKVFFVGIDDTGKHIRIDNVPPLILTVLDMQVDIDERGSLYNIMFLHSTALPFQQSVATNSTGVLVKASGTVQSALEQIAQAYTLDSQENVKNVKGGRAMVYKIVLDDNIREVASWPVTEGRANRTQGANGANPLSIAAGTPVEAAINQVFSACQQYLTQANNTNSDDSFRYKIIAAVYRTAATTEVIYHIVKYKWRDRYKLSEKSRDAVASERDNHPEYGIFEATDPVLIYDYVFTGNSTDIVKFDMKINEGLGFFQTLTDIQTYSNNYGEANVSRAGIAFAPGAGTTLYGDPTIHPDSSVGTRQASQLVVSKNQPLSARKAEYDSKLFEHLSLEAMKMGAALTVRGNPGWLSCFAIDPKLIARPNEPRSGIGFAPGEFYTDNIPFIYINVQMPATWTGNQEPTPNPTMERFWYRGVWEVLSIETYMDSQGFRHELNLLAAPLETKRPTQQDRPMTSETAQAQVPEEKMDQPAPPPTKPATPTTPGVINSPNGKFSRATTRYDTQITPAFKYGDILRTSKADWQNGENDPPNDEIFDNLIYTLERLQIVRDLLGVPVTINSGYRNATVNRRVGGAQNSDHSVGLAVDFRAPTFKSGNVNQIVQFLLNSGIEFKQVIEEKPPGSNGWVHISWSRAPSGNKKQALAYFGSGYSPFKARG